MHDPALAAELTVRTFAGAWASRDREGLVDAARERAEVRVLESGPVGPDEETPGLLPVRRARIVADLELQGIPTQPAPPVEPRPRRRPVPTVPGKVGRWGLVGAAAAALTIAGVTTLIDDPATVEADAAPRPSTTSVSWPDRRLVALESATSVTTAAPQTTTTTAASTATTVRPRPAPGSPPTTVATPLPPPTPTPGPPSFRSATAFFRPQDAGLCSKSNESLLTIQWTVVNATQAWIYRDAEPWEAVSAGSGTAQYCSPSTREYHLVARDAQGREARATVTAPGLP